MSQHSLNNASSALNRHGERVSHNSRERLGDEVMGSKTSISSKYLEKFLVKSDLMFRNQWEEHNNYQSIRVKYYQWLVIRIKEKATSAITQFHHTYVVIC